MKKTHPLLLAYSLVLLVTGLLIIKTGDSSPMAVMNRFMGLSFVIFGLSKVFNLSAFIEDFRKYDFLAKRFASYAKAYPFVEVWIGLYFLFVGSNLIITTLTLIVLLFNLVSLYGTFKKGDSVLCVCLGRKLAFPFDRWLILENLFMLIMVGYMIVGLLSFGGGMEQMPM